MKRRSFVSAACIGVGAAYVGILSPLRAENVGSDSGTSVPLRIPLLTPGRIGFYVDYSELDDIGFHTFYVYRTHGTSGQVSIRYRTSGDPHNEVDDILTWRDGEADVKFFSVEVLSKSLGTHRIVAALSEPTGGAELHFGSEHTVAYGVIDDGSITTDAVFFDSDASVNGDGTETNPFDNIYDAISGVGSARYVYGKGIVVVDGTNTTSIFGATHDAITPPTGRSEVDRIYIEKWPGQDRFVIQGAGGNVSYGFAVGESDSGVGSWVTYRGIQFQNLGAGIRYNYNDATGVNVEFCSFDEMDNGSNVSGYMPWGVDGSKVWRSTARNIRVNGSTSNNNSGGIVISYDGRNLSVQRCMMSNTAHGTFQKRIRSGGTGVDVSINVKFSHFIGCDAHYSVSGTSGASHSFSIVQGNVFQNNGGPGIYHLTTNDQNVGVKSGWWCNNIFDNCGSGEIAAIHTQMANGAIIFNNIMANCRKVWADIADESPVSDIEYADFNHEFGTTLSGQRYEWRGGNFNSAASLAMTSCHESNPSVGDPLFRDRAVRDYALLPGSPAAVSGPTGTNKGIFLTGVEVVGPNTGEAVIAPARMNPPSVT